MYEANVMYLASNQTCKTENGMGSTVQKEKGMKYGVNGRMCVNESGDTD